MFEGKSPQSAFGERGAFKDKSPQIKRKRETFSKRKSLAIKKS